MRNIQHHREARYFYRFLSRFYDHYVNPLFWTPPMRQRALELAQLDSENLEIIDVGAGTGFTSSGVVAATVPSRLTLVDQSADQLGRAWCKAALHDCAFCLGDAQQLPLRGERFDRYISAGSIEYWPDPLQGIAEAYRVLKPGGVALMIGPLRPQGFLSRTLADIWMLFPEEEDYRRWFTEAGFIDLKSLYLRPYWVRREKYGLAISGRKPPQAARAISSARQSPSRPTVSEKPAGNLRLLLRLSAGFLAGFLFIPLALAGHGLSAVRRLAGISPDEDFVPLNTRQRVVLLAILLAALILIFSIFTV